MASSLPSSSEPVCERYCDTYPDCRCGVPKPDGPPPHWHEYVGGRCINCGAAGPGGSIASRSDVR